MKYFLIIFALIEFAGDLKAQNPLSIGQNQLNIGIGLADRSIPVYLGLDHCVSIDFTLGGEVSYRSYRDRWNRKYYDHSVVGISGNANYHFNRIMRIPRNWDFYAGLNLGFYFWSSPNEYKGTHNSGVELGAQVGGRYYFSNSFGVNLEFSGGNAFSGSKFGLSFKL